MTGLAMADFVKIAHRGSSGSYPENTRLAFERAIESGVNMIEMDCQLSKDGHVVVIHDERLERTAKARGFVKAKTLKQLKKLDAGGWFKKSFRGERILTLEEALEIVAGKVDVNLDVKSVPRAPLGMEIKILFILSHYDYLERTVLSSFNYRTLRRFRELAPDARIGILYGAGIRENPFQAAREVNAYSIHIQKELATPQFLERGGQLGLRNYVWTVNEVKEMEKFLSLGVDGIISDFPEKFWKVKPRKR